LRFPMRKGGMVGEDFEPRAGEDGFPLLEAVDDGEHLLIVRRVVAFGLIEGPGMEAGRVYGLIIFALAIVTSNRIGYCHRPLEISGRGCRN
jgi:hypothetical protein